MFKNAMLRARTWYNVRVFFNGLTYKGLLLFIFHPKYAWRMLAHRHAKWVEDNGDRYRLEWGPYSEWGYDTVGGFGYAWTLFGISLEYCTDCCETTWLIRIDQDPEPFSKQRTIKLYHKYNYTF